MDLCWKRVDDMMIRRKSNRISNNKGTTMVETISAFAVLMVITAVLYGIIALCSELRMQATDAGRVIREFDRELYNQKEGSTLITKRNYETKNNVPLFYITVNTEDTTPGNLKNEETTDMTREISLYNICAKTYTYNVSSENAGHIVVPKAVQFIHKTDWTDN